MRQRCRAMIFSIISPCGARGVIFRKGITLVPTGSVTCMDEKFIWSKFSQNAPRCLKSGHKFVIKSAAKRNENRLTNKKRRRKLFWNTGFAYTIARNGT